MKFPLAFAFSATLVVPALAQNNPQLGPGVPAFQVRPGYKVTLVAQNFGESRFLQFDDKGTLYVSQPGSKTIASLKWRDGKYEKVADFTTNKDRVHGLDFKDGWLWFTESGSVWKARDTNGDGKSDEEIQVVKGLPDGGGHWQRSILVANDGFYTSIGDPQNLSIPEDSGPDRQKIWKYSLDGTTRTLWIEGLRNTEKLRFRPGTTEVWGADHGSDNYGKTWGEGGDKKQPITDRVPPCEFNRYDQGKFYGHPFVIGNGMPRPEYNDRPDILEIVAKTTLPQWQLGAHWAPNGWTFTTTEGIGPKGDAYIANHGSWNSTAKVGYRVEHVFIDQVTGNAMGAEMLVSTLGPDGAVLGRPVDVVEEKSGSLLFSDDGRGRIYRVEKIK
jgi:glucose/arabinose dehydrogenase